jgi:hypothetical protein
MARANINANAANNTLREVRRSRLFEAFGNSEEPTNLNTLNLVIIGNRLIIFWLFFITPPDCLRFCVTSAI